MDIDNNQENLDEEKGILDWDSIRMKDCPKINCSNCKLKSSYHPFYIEAGITGCVGVKCEKMEDVAKRLLEFRSYKFIKIDRTGYEPKIFFQCDKEYPHTHYVTFRRLRLGIGCNPCKIEKKKKTVSVKKEAEKCNCKKLRLGKQFGPSYVCSHYNFQVLYPDLALQWDVELNNGLTPDKVSPHSAKKYWFRCSNKKCNLPYDQPLKKKTSRGDGCPFCRGIRVCLENSLLSTHPELCKELDPDNDIKPDEITHGSSVKVGWLCFNHGEKVHKYRTSPALRTSPNHMTGCRRCNFSGYDQEAGGHEHFLKEAKKAHPYENYSYPENYINNTTPINIYCPVSTGGSFPPQPHGLFLQTPESHKLGRGCPKCADERSESKIIKDLKYIINNMGYKINEDYFPEKTFPDMKHINSLHIDLFFPKIKDIPLPIAFERDGKQHFVSVKYWGGNKNLSETQKRDQAKDLYCVENKINLIRIPYNVKITEEYINNIFELCKKSQVYMSYSHYHECVGKSFDLSTINSIIIPH